MARFETGINHPKWKGGRTKLSSGYIGIRVPEGHHLRMNNGYAYEHQLVAEQILGRALRDNEIVHHKNGDKTDNRPENIEVCDSIPEHKFIHRTKRANLRVPNEENPIVNCACGCGISFPKYDESGRPRMFARGGHWRKGKKGGWITC